MEFWAAAIADARRTPLEPVMVRYIAHLNGGLDSAGVRTRQRFLMQSNGGVMSAEQVVAKPITTALSGPAAMLPTHPRTAMQAPILSGRRPG